MTTRRSTLLVTLALGALCAGVCTPAPPAPPPRSEVRADCTSYEPLRRPLFGELHVHTYHSVDADTRGTRVLPEEAYDFAKGLPLLIQPWDAMGNPINLVQIDRPLDFAAVTDHSEVFGELRICREPGYAGWFSNDCVTYRSDPALAGTIFLAPVALAQNQVARNVGICGADGSDCVTASASIWGEIQDAAEAHYDRSAACSFTTFVGYEWTGAPAVANLHRNVIFRNAAVPAVPASYLDYPYPEELWDALEQECLIGTPGCDALVIPHNTNMGRGRGFETVDKFGNPFDAVRAERQSQFEPLVEVAQAKGTSECRPETSPSDELCDFELVPWNNIAGYLGFGAPLPEDFARNALREGLVQEQTVGGNPFRFGLIGSTDNHTGTPGFAQEDQSVDHDAGDANDPGAAPVGLFQNPYNSNGALAVVWAEENSRDAIFDALERRETYATSGTRPIVRFFGGWKLPADLCSENDPVLKADQMGVPMGGELAPRLGADWTPRFYLSATKDPGTLAYPGIDLQRVQIIKGWVDASDQSHEQVYEVAGDPNNGASVDTATCTPQGAGFAELCGVWEDPDFDATEGAFYYARVVENPVCRWSQHQCNAAGVDCAVPATITAGFEPCCDGSVPATIQERAWTSPIWYRPGSGL